MTDTNEQPNLPVAIAAAVAGIPAAFVPSCIKALDRLIGATIDIPVAWLAQRKANIEAQTKSFGIVEAAIAQAVASEAGADPAIVGRAAKALVRKAYREQNNREAVCTAMVEELASAPSERPSGESVAEDAAPSIDDDWLNVFERYAEGASTERMQKLWGRVLAGEVRAPGRYALRTLRFLSELSQSDALAFSQLSDMAFGDFAPASLVKPDYKKDIRDLIFLEAAGLIQGASGLGFGRPLAFEGGGLVVMREGNIAILFEAKPGVTVMSKGVAVTPLGQELLGLLPGRDVRGVARRVGLAMRQPQIKAAHIATIEGNNIVPIEVLWGESRAGR